MIRKIRVYQRRNNNIYFLMPLAFYWVFPDDIHGAYKLKEKFTYIAVLMTTILFGYFLLAANRYVYASDVPSIAFSSKRNENYDIYMMDINGKNLQQLKQTI